MSGTTSLMQALLGPSVTAAEAKQALEDAELSGVDPLHWCAVRHGIDPAEVMRRASLWAGLAFAPHIPPETAPSRNAPRLTDLPDIRTIARGTGDQRTVFAAPDFTGVLRLRKAANDRKDIRSSLHLVTRQALRESLVIALGESLIGSARHSTVRAWPHAAAELDLTVPIRWAFAICLMLLTLAVLLAPLIGPPWLIPFWLLIMASPTVIRICALLTPRLPAPPDAHIPEADLPNYSILVPLRDEANMVDQLCTALGALDYPPEKLEISFVVESRSPTTVDAVRRHLTDARFSLIVVPDAAPRTKPKALNFALPYCRGEFLVVYDAEDRPDPAQLRKIVSQFRQQPDVQCIQARLVIANGETGLMPALFAGEYAGLFAAILPTLARWGAVMPLGGTSNHFRLATLRSLGGWDAYNVTEDADLGVRLARRRLRTATSDSFTLEDAPVKLRPWLGQRTRWLKGWMQTFVVHNRRPGLLRADLGWRGFLLFELVIVSMMIAPLLHVAFIPLLIWTQVQGFDTFGWSGPWTMVCLAMLVIAYAANIGTNVVGLARTGQKYLWLQQLFQPIYWMLITYAAYRALTDFVHRPFHWFKSPHQTIVRLAVRGRTVPALAPKPDG